MRTCRPTPPRDITVDSKKQADSVFAIRILTRGTHRSKDLMRPLPVCEIDHSYLDWELIDREFTQPGTLSELKRRHPESKRSK